MVKNVSLTTSRLHSLQNSLIAVFTFIFFSEGCEHSEFQRQRGSSLERLLDLDEKAKFIPLRRAGIRSALQTWHKERSRERGDDNNNTNNNNINNDKTTHKKELAKDLRLVLQWFMSACVLIEL